MALAIGTRLGAYEITGQLGAGGMDEVYRALDTKLGREAKLLAALNHAHIASVYWPRRARRHAVCSPI